MDQIFFGNTLVAYIWFGSWIIGALFLKKPIANLIINILAGIFKKHLYETNSKEFRNILSKRLANFILIIALYIAVQQIDFPQSWNLAAVDDFGLRKVLVVIYGLIFGISLIGVILDIIDCVKLVITNKFESKEIGSHKAKVIPFATDFIKIIVAIFTGLVVLSEVFNINVGTLVAGLGIGGLAVALAAKDTFENLLGSFVIYFDKPFFIGEFIYLNDTYCTVDRVGLRSTRFRTVDRTYMTLPNKKVVENAIYNYSMRDMRRVDRMVQLSRATSHTQMTKIVGEIKEYILNNERTNHESIYVNFNEITPISLDIRTQYYVAIDDWSVYLEVVEEVNLKILEIIESNNAELAYPTTNVNLNKK